MAAAITTSTTANTSPEPSLPLRREPVAALGFRVALALLTMAAVAWGAWAVGGFWRAAGIAQIADRVLYGDPFPLPDLLALEPRLLGAETGPCAPRAVRSASIIRLRIAERTLDTADLAHLDRRLETLDRSLRASLACTPSDAFLWLALFWTQTTRQGFAPSDLALLRMSFRHGPNEGWVALRRIRIALPLYDQLAPDLQAGVRADFAGIARAGFVLPVADILGGVGRGREAILLPLLAGMRDLDRDALARVLSERGSPVVVPGAPVGTRRR